jgi:hypothetical protein
MLTDLILAFRIARVVCGYFNRAAVCHQPKAVRRFLMRKSHRRIAALVDLSQMCIVLVMHLIRRIVFISRLSGGLRSASREQSHRSR